MLSFIVSQLNKSLKIIQHLWVKTKYGYNLQRAMNLQLICKLFAEMPDIYHFGF